MNRSTPLVDVVIPMHNAAATIARALQSLQAQSVEDWHAIVIDDASIDDSVMAVNSNQDPRVSLVSQEHAGVSGARNHAMRISDAKFVCFLDADDTLEPSFIAEMLPIAESSECGSMCSCSLVNACGEPMFPVSPPTIQSLSPSTMLTMDCPPIMSILHRRESLDRVSVHGNLFDEQLDAFEDWDMLMRLVCEFGSSEKQWGMVNQALCSYWCSPMSLSADHQRVHHRGLAMINRYGDKSHLRPWVLRSWSACIAMRNREMADELLLELGGLQKDDLGVVLGALRWQLCRRYAIAHDEICALSSTIPGFIESLGAYQGTAAMQELLADIRSWGGDRWVLAVTKAMNLLEGNGRLVIYGLGHNGQQIRQAARSMMQTVFVMDDDQSRIGQADQQLALDDLRSGDLVLVTPDDANGMLNTVMMQTPARAMSIRQLIRPEHPNTTGAPR